MLYRNSIKTESLSADYHERFCPLSLQNSGCGLLSPVTASVGSEGMVSFLQIIIFHAVTMCVCGFKPILFLIFLF